MTGDEMFDAIEANLSFKWSHERQHAFTYVGIQYIDEGKMDKYKQMEWEALLFASMDSPTHPSFCIIPQESIEYFKLRFNTTTNPIHKARYADFICLALPPSKERYRFAQQAIDGYLNLIELYLHQLVDNQIYVALARATQIAKIFNYKKQDIADRVTYVIDKLIAANQFDWISRIIDGALHLGIDSFSQSSLEHLVTQISETIEKLEELAQKSLNYERALKYDFLRMGLETKVCLYKSMGSNHEEWQTKLAIIQSYLKQAESEELVGDRNTVSHWLEKAYAYVRKIEAHELPSKIKNYLNKVKNDLKRQIIEANIAVYNAMVVMEFEQKISCQKIDAIVNSFITHDLKTSLRQIGFSFLVPINKIQEEVKNNQSIFKLIHPHVLDQWGKNVSAPKSDEEIFEFEMARSILLCLLNNNWIVSIVFERLIQEKGLNTEAFMEFLLEGIVFKNMDISLIRCGIEHYFKEDFSAAIHLLCPQVEAAFRTLLWLFGGATTTSPRKSVPEDAVLIVMSLENILNHECLQCLPNDFLAPVRTLFTDPNGLNLRNDLSHGLLSFEKCTRCTTELILQVFLLLASSIKEVTTKDNQQ